jgi:hypothetical protein
VTKRAENYQDEDDEIMLRALATTGSGREDFNVSVEK